MKNYKNRKYKKTINWAQLSPVERAFQKFSKAHKTMKDKREYVAKYVVARMRNKSTQLYGVWKELNGGDNYEYRSDIW